MWICSKTFWLMISTNKYFFRSAKLFWTCSKFWCRKQTVKEKGQITIHTLGLINFAGKNEMCVRENGFLWSHKSPLCSLPYAARTHDFSGQTNNFNIFIVITIFKLEYEWVKEWENSIILALFVHGCREHYHYYDYC